MQKYIYIIQSKDLYKIGYSEDPRKRISDIKTGNPNAILVDFWETNNYRQHESQIHKKLSVYHFDGEWFKCDYETCEKVIFEILKINTRKNFNGFKKEIFPNQNKLFVNDRDFTVFQDGVEKIKMEDVSSWMFKSQIGFRLKQKILKDICVIYQVNNHIEKLIGIEIDKYVYEVLKSSNIESLVNLHIKLRKFTKHIKKQNNIDVKTRQQMNNYIKFKKDFKEEYKIPMKYACY